MLKRNQILLQDWQEEYIKFVSKTYDVSISEAVRTIINITAVVLLKEFFPKHKTKISLKDIANAFKRLQNGDICEEKFYAMMSDLYYEARKIIEYRMAQKKR
ncbi:MAG: hypothetical protein FJZ10_01020 [Candidatus Omnitrophica bacterium]|nr:hypothetical protein [Candidatus Omnitrophota bacterium]